jgi:hypothetical protein
VIVRTQLLCLCLHYGHSLAFLFAVEILIFYIPGKEINKVATKVKLTGSVICLQNVAPSVGLIDALGAHM